MTWFWKSKGDVVLALAILVAAVVFVFMRRGLSDGVLVLWFILLTSLYWVAFLVWCLKSRDEDLEYLEHELGKADDELDEKDAKLAAHALLITLLRAAEFETNDQALDGAVRAIVPNPRAVDAE